MALVSLRQLLDHAAENGYGLPAFNVNNLEQVKAIMEAADECNSPVIMQGSAGARKYAGEAFPASPDRGCCGNVSRIFQSLCTRITVLQKQCVSMLSAPVSPA